MRRFKRWAGSLAFRIGGGLWRITHPARPAQGDPRSILVVNLLRIGDTVVTFPALESLRRRFPSARITLVVRTLVESLVRPLTCVDEVIAHDGDNSRLSCARLEPKLPSADLALVLDTSPWAILAARRRARRVVAYDSLGMGFAATDRVEAPRVWNLPLRHYRPGDHAPYQGDAWHALVERVGAQASFAIPVWTPPQADVQEASRWLDGEGIHDGFVLLHPVSDPSYRWDVARWHELGRRLKVPVVVGGGPADSEIVSQVASGIPGSRMFISSSLARYGALLSLARHVVSVDTSAAHLAAAVGTGLTVLFGPGDPRIWAPRGRASVGVVEARSACVGCKRARCFRPTHECMDSLHVDRVLSGLPRELQA
ncbi:MAG: glycosyltransferase family 9 protein [Planctomycetota bacterium]